MLKVLSFWASDWYFKLEYKQYEHGGPFVFVGPRL